MKQYINKLENMQAQTETLSQDFVTMNKEKEEMILMVNKLKIKQRPIEPNKKKQKKESNPN
jgi:hypothetical protein